MVDSGVIDRIFTDVDIRATDRVLEIGPGRGALTQRLEKLSNDCSAIELDRDLISTLESQTSRIKILQGDALLFPEHYFQDHRIIGNLPYEISTPLLIKLVEIPQIIDMHFMLQREVAQRLCASPGTKEYGRLSLVVSLFCEVSELFDVGPESFRPIPKIRSTFVRLIPRQTLQSGLDHTSFKEVVRLAFSQRRKTLRNSLQKFGLDWSRLSVDAQKRADHASLDDYLELAKHVKQGDSESSLTD